MTMVSGSKWWDENEEDNEVRCHCSYLHFLEWKFFLSSKALYEIVA
jgi:hypothetical protein